MEDGFCSKELQKTGRNRRKEGVREGKGKGERGKGKKEEGPISKKLALCHV
jgi:hypothetical protein